ncbi:sensor histidine kinase [Variovorax ginsengisoli]|uniref:histidine kinase n=1 Tax=Variovorax ginsengisoli TaxID=363844 RepID=A0ABT9S5G7_9BURK|nr:HAMP domain-containing sensor histidine kinase [Variovorax ginsengisoli]MDP9899608.1 signal transduction histidine kinase [Variovorax ginsengisoli]
MGAGQSTGDDASTQGARGEHALTAQHLCMLLGHDLRNPLAAIDLATHLIARGPLEPSQASALAHIVSATQRAQELISELIDCIDSTRGRGLAIHKQSVTLHALVADALAARSRGSPAPVLEHDRIGEGACTADPARLAQLLDHLVGNALAHGAPQRPVIVASIIEASCFRIVVHNEGPMVPTERMPALFEPVSNGRTTPSGRSVGLGLFFVRQIAHAHDGEVHLRSDASGTTVTVRFPRTADA